MTSPQLTDQDGNRHLPAHKGRETRPDGFGLPQTSWKHPRQDSPRKGSISIIGIAAYVLILASATLHFYRSPYWSMDLLAYMGNALLNETDDPVVLHKRVYSELRLSVPPDAFALLVGAPGVHDEHGEKRDRFLNPFHYCEFLPFFAIRPLYNQAIYWIGRSGLGLVGAVRLLSASSYYLLGIIVLVWLLGYTAKAPLFALLIMLVPHITLLGRNTGCDAISVLLGVLSLYLIFERHHFFIGLLLLMVAIWVRTDNIGLVVPVLFVAWLQKRLEAWKAAVLVTIAVISVLVIDHAAGHYGIHMLYYDTFIGMPMAPGEMSAHFTLGQYARLFIDGYKEMLISFVPLFVLLGMIGWNRKTAPLLGIATAYALIHYVILPNWVDRYMAVFYLVTAVAAVIATQSGRRGEQASLVPE